MKELISALALVGVLMAAMYVVGYLHSGRSYERGFRRGYKAGRKARDDEPTLALKFKHTGRHRPTRSTRRPHAKPAAHPSRVGSMYN